MQPLRCVTRCREACSIVDRPRSMRGCSSQALTSWLEGALCEFTAQPFFDLVVYICRTSCIAWQNNRQRSARLSSLRCVVLLLSLLCGASFREDIHLFLQCIWAGHDLCFQFRLCDLRDLRAAYVNLGEVCAILHRLLHSRICSVATSVLVWPRLCTIHTIMFVGRLHIYLENLATLLPLSVRRRRLVWHASCGSPRWRSRQPGARLEYIISVHCLKIAGLLLRDTGRLGR
jgi:hypothetical protein